MSNITAGAMRADNEIMSLVKRAQDLNSPILRGDIAGIIERETGCAGMLEVLKACVQHPNFAGCLPELVERVNEVIRREP